MVLVVELMYCSGPQRPSKHLTQSPNSISLFKSSCIERMPYHSKIAVLTHQAGLPNGLKKNLFDLHLTNGVSFLGHHSLLKFHHFDSIQPNLKKVVDKGQKWCKRKSSHENSGEAVLDH